MGLIGNLGNIPFVSILKGATTGNQLRLMKTSKDVTAVCVHGFGTSRYSMNKIEEALKEEGFPVKSFKFGKFGGHLNVEKIDKVSADLHQKIQSLKAKGEIKDFQIIAHSKGGLIAANYGLKYGDSSLKRITTLGTPWKGVWLALLGYIVLGKWAPSTRDMIPGSEFLTTLHSQFEEKACSFELSIVGGGVDWIVPFKRAICPFGIVKKFKRLGHIGLVTDQKVLDFLLNQMRELESHN